MGSLPELLWAASAIEWRGIMDTPVMFYLRRIYCAIYKDAERNKFSAPTCIMLSLDNVNLLCTVKTLSKSDFCLYPDQYSVCLERERAVFSG